MKIPPLFLFFLLLTCATLHAQQSAIRGEVSIINSQYETKVRQYVANAQVEEDFGRAQSTTTDAAGLFRLVMVGVKEKESITFTVKKEGLEVVNMDALNAVAGQSDMVKIYMATPQKIAEYKRQYYQIGKTSAEKALEEKLKKLQSERQALLADKNADKTRIRDLETQLGLLEAQRARIDDDARELARRYAPVNLDDTSPLYQEAFSWFQKGDLAKALEVLRQADLAGQARNILAERAKIDTAQRELLQRDSLQKQRTVDVLKALQLKADLHQSRFEWDSTTVCFEWMLELDSLNYNTVVFFASFLEQQNQFDRAIHYFEEALKLSNLDLVRGTIHNSIGNLYRRTQNMAQAEKAYLDALSLYRRSVEKQPNIFLPFLATAINNLGVLYTDNKLMPQAEAALLEALTINRQLNLNNPGVFSSEVAMNLGNLGEFYRVNQRLNQADTFNNEALQIYKALEENNPNAFLFHIAITLNNIGNCYSDMQLLPMAETALSEALGIHRRLATNNPDAYLPGLAMALNNLGNLYGDILMMQEAEEFYLEALQIQKQLADKNPDAYLPNLAAILSNLGAHFKGNQKIEHAQQYYEEALQLYTILAEKNPTIFEDNLYSSINTLGYLFLFTGKSEEAIKLIQRALSLSPENEWTVNILALAYLLNNQFDKAQKIILEYKDKPYPWNPQFSTYKDVALFCLDELEKSGISHADFLKIRSLLTE